MRKILLTSLLCLFAISAQAQTIMRLSATEDHGDLAALNAFVDIQASTGDGWGTIAVDVAGTYVGQITAKCTLQDGVAAPYRDIVLSPQTTSPTQLTTLASGATGMWKGDATGCKRIEAIMGAYTSGTATVYLRAVYTGGASSPSNVSVGDVTAGAQPANDPHYVKCSDASVAAPCLVTLSGTNNINNIGGTVSLPTGAATAALQTTLNGLVDQLEGYTDGLEALITATNSALTTIDGRVDGLEALIGTTNTNTGSVVTNTGTSATNSNTLVTSNAAVKTAVEALSALISSGAFAVNVAKIGGATVPSDDPCVSGTKHFTAISQTTSTMLIAGTSSTREWVCFFAVKAADTEIVSLVGGTTGGTCGTSTDALIGSTTAANGLTLTSEGFVMGSGAASIQKTQTNADDICLLQSGSGRISGVLVTVSQ